MSQINSNTKDDFQVVLLLSCFVGHPVHAPLNDRSAFDWSNVDWSNVHIWTNICSFQKV